MDSNAIDIKTMLNESQKFASAMMLAHESGGADSSLQQIDMQVVQANRQQNPLGQPLTTSKVDLVKVIQKPQIVDQTLNDSQGNLASQAINKRGPALRNIQKQLE